MTCQIEYIIQKCFLSFDSYNHENGTEKKEEKNTHNIVTRSTDLNHKYIPPWIYTLEPWYWLEIPQGHVVAIYIKY